jgi:excisionase family DNA binding protein
MYLSTQEAAEILGVSRPRVLKLIYDKRLPAAKKKGISGWLIEEKALELVKNRKNGRPKKVNAIKKLRYGE